MGIKLYRFLLGFIGFVELCIGFYWVLLGLSNYGVRRKRGIRHFMGFVATEFVTLWGLSLMGIVTL